MTRKDSNNPRQPGDQSGESISELEMLLVELELGELDELGRDKIRSILRKDADARKAYLNWQVVQVALTNNEVPVSSVDATGVAEVNDDAPEKVIPVSVKHQVPKRVSGRFDRKHFQLGWIAAALLFLCLVWVFLTNRSGDPDDRSAKATSKETVGQAKSEQTAEGVAIITKLVGVTWSEGMNQLDTGDALKTGRLAIEEGLMQVEFFSGATVVIEGPAEMELKSPELARVIRGRLRANVPEIARGFSLEVEDMKVVDLGTEFGLSVDSSRTDVQVFDGEVELHPISELVPSSRDKRTMKAGEGLSWKTHGQLVSKPVEPKAFVSQSELESRRGQQVLARSDRWKSWADAMKLDPRVIAFYSFDQPGEWYRKLTCDSAIENWTLQGAIIGAQRVTGRWSTKHGLEFKKPGDRVRMKIPGEFGSLTFATWIKIDSLDRMYNSLFLTDNYNQGEPHWQILDTGQLFFSVRWRPDSWVEGKSPNGPAHHPVISPPFWKPGLGGKWIHLATTFSVDTGRVTHYLDGEPFHSETIPDHLMVKRTRIGEATMGNWSLPTRNDSRFAIRNLNGTMDEMLILADELSAAEIKKIYQAGKP